MSVYVIRVAGTDLHRVGHTPEATADEELRLLQAGSPWELEVVACEPGGRGVEHWVCGLVAPLRVRGAWFSLPPSVLESVLKALREVVAVQCTTCGARHYVPGGERWCRSCDSRDVIALPRGYVTRAAFIGARLGRPRKTVVKEKEPEPQIVRGPLRLIKGEK